MVICIYLQSKGGTFMNHRRFLTILAAFVLLETTGCTFSPAPSPDDSSSPAHSSAAPLVQEGPIRLYASQNSDGVYHHITVEDEKTGRSRGYDWQTVSSPGYEPLVYQTDLNEDGEAEAVVITTRGYGTGTYITEPHIVDWNSTRELDVQDPLDYTRDQVSFSILHQEGKQIVQARVPGQPAVALPVNTSHSAELPQFGSVIRYYVDDHNKLNAEVAAQMSDGVAVGTVILQYGWQTGALRVEDIKLEAVAS